MYAGDVYSCRRSKRTVRISRSKAYGVVRQLNDELKERGLITLNGKVSRKYFMEKIYGSDNVDKQ